MKKKLIRFSAIFVFVIVFLMSPLAPYLKSLLVMKVYSYMNERESFINEKGIEINIPGGGITEEKDWYPFVMTYNADDFGPSIGQPSTDLTIMYNFPAFDLSKGCSHIYDDKSPYYNGFYGAYVVSGKYGFHEDGRFDEQSASSVPEFDMRKLVLEDLGMPARDGVFEWEIISSEEEVSYAGYDEWIKLDADMLVNGALHRVKENYRNYIQYGKPKYDVEEDFLPIKMKGRIYARYFAKQDCSIYFYVLAKDYDVLEKCDKEILSKSEVLLLDEN